MCPWVLHNLQPGKGLVQALLGRQNLPGQGKVIETGSFFSPWSCLSTLRPPEGSKRLSFWLAHFFWFLSVARLGMTQVGKEGKYRVLSHPLSHLSLLQGLCGFWGILLLVTVPILYARPYMLPRWSSPPMSGIHSFLKARFSFS